MNILLLLKLYLYWLTFYMASIIIPKESYFSILSCCLFLSTETALHIAVKNKHHIIVSMLLTAGANPNLRVYLPDDEMARLAEDEYIFTGKFVVYLCLVL